MIPYFILAAVVGLLALTNFQSGTYLTGWDNLHPEFNFPVNIMRSLFSAWQEYQGLGLLGGMGHASDLIRQLFLLVLSVVIPTNQIRFTWTMLTLLIGAAGMYTLLAQIVLKKDTSDSPVGRQIIAFVGALFYIFNLSTLQSYYVPFEVFTTHFAFLPWLIFTTLNFLKKQSVKTFLLLFVTVLLSTPQGYVPTIFVVYMLATLIILLFHLPRWPITRAKSKHYVKRAGLVLLTIFILNAFWILPFAHFTVTNSPVNVNAKINQMATEMIFSLNKESGIVPDVAILKGFWFQSVEPNKIGTYAYILAPWRTHLENPIVLGIGYLFFAIVLFGALASIKTKNKIWLMFTMLFVVAFSLIAIATPPFSWIDGLLRTVVPLYNQVFRFPFTKFSLFACFTYAVLFAIGISALSSLIRTKLHRVKPLYIAVPIVILLTIYMFPLLQGHLFYERQQVKIPNEYFELFDFFKKQDQNTRIANFPQYTFWSWNYYRWGYTGSGFLWYGIKQPILDRAFDVWGKTNENYYFEVSHAMYAKDPVLFEKILQKYDVNWILVDNNIYNPESPRAVFTPELKEMLGAIPSVIPVKKFGALEVYKVDLKHKPNQFVYLESNIPSINNYAWANYDQSFVNHSDYLSYPSTSKTNPDYLYPFRSLFSGKTQKDTEFTLQETKDTIVFKNPVIKNDKKTIIHIPSYLDKEHLIPAEFVIEKDPDGANVLTMHLILPKVYLNNKKIWGEDIVLTLYTLSDKSSDSFLMNVNGIANFSVKVDPKKGKTVVGTTFLPLKQDSFIVLSNKDKSQAVTQSIPVSFLRALPAIQQESNLVVNNIPDNSYIQVVLPKVSDSYTNFTINPTENNKLRSCNAFRKGDIISKIEKPDLFTLTTKDSTACIAFDSPNLSHEESYAVFIKSQNKSGRGLHFWILNEDQKYGPIDTYLDRTKNLSTLGYVLTPAETFGKGYSIHFDSISIADDTAVNTLGSVSMYPISYRFVTSMVLSYNQEDLNTIQKISLSTSFLEKQQQQNTVSSVLTVSHPNESVYEITNLDRAFTKQVIETNPILVLSQSFDNGWRAYEMANGKWQMANLFPFLFGREIKNHVMVNNWENGWKLDQYKPSKDAKIIIVYMPQYLEYFGFILIVLLGISAIFIAITKKSSIVENTILNLDRKLKKWYHPLGKKTS